MNILPWLSMPWGVSLVRWPEWRPNLLEPSSGQADISGVIQHMTFNTMKLESFVRTWPRILGPVLLLAMAPAFAADQSSPEYDDMGASASAAPMEVSGDSSTGAHGQLIVAPEILSSEMDNDLVYTITTEPLHGRVGLAGGDDDADFFQTKTSRIGYFAYRPDENFTGMDSFAYTVHNETSGLAFQNTVKITVSLPPPIMLEKVNVEASHLRFINVRSVSLTTRPNTPVTRMVPSHEDFMSPADRIVTAADGRAEIACRPYRPRGVEGFLRAGRPGKTAAWHGQTRPRHRPTHLCTGPGLHR